MGLLPPGQALVVRRLDEHPHYQLPRLVVRPQQHGPFHGPPEPLPRLVVDDPFGHAKPRPFHTGSTTPAA
jgi:hypothetical protein